MHRELLDVLMGSPSVHQGAKTTFYFLWRLCGNAPGHITIDKYRLSQLTHRDPRTEEECLKHLDQIGLVELGAWNKRTGAIEVWVWQPAPGPPRRPRPTPQQVFDFLEPASTVSGPEPDPTVSGPEPDPTVSGPEPDPTVSGPEPDPTVSGPEPDPTVSGPEPDPWFSPRGGLEDFAQNPPGAGGGGFCAKSSRRHSCATQREPGGETPRARTQCNQRNKEEYSKISPKVQRNKEELCDIGRGPEDFAQNPPPRRHGLAEVGSLAGAALAEIVRETPPSELRQQKHLLARAVCAVCDQPAGWWVSGSAADLVVLFGWPAKELQALLNQLLRRRRLPEDHHDHIRNPGGWLQHRLKNKAGELGMRWGRTTN